MRKKRHLKISPENKEYDKYYLSNYINGENQTISNRKMSKGAPRTRVKDEEDDGEPYPFFLGMFSISPLGLILSSQGLLERNRG